MKLQLTTVNQGFKLVFTMLFASLLLHSCYKDRLGIDKISGGTWNPKLAVPLFYGDLEMSKVVEGSQDNWLEDADGLLSLVYRGDTVSNNAEQLISFPDQANDTSLAFNIPAALFPGDSTSKIFILNTKYTTNNNERIDSILIKSGTMTFEVTTNINHSSYVDIIIPQLTKYGVTFNKRVDIPYTGGTSSVVSITVQMYDYLLRLNLNGSNSNQVDEYVKVMVHRGNGANNSPYTVSLKQNVNNITYYEAFGYFHQHLFNIDRTKIAISIFDNLHFTEIIAEDPILRLMFTNSYGMPIDVTFTDLYVERDNIKKDFISSFLPTFSLMYAANPSQAAQPSNFALNSSNSNIVDIINFNPTSLIYRGSAITNPTGNLIPNFVKDTSNVNLAVELEIPLFGRALNFTINDTTKIDFSSFFVWDQLKSITLNINTLNYFPIDASLQLYLADSNNVTFDSVFVGQENILLAGVPSAPPEYRVTVPMHQMTTVTLTEEKLISLKNARKLIISASASTFSQGSKIVKIYSDNKISVELSALGDYTTEY